MVYLDARECQWRFLPAALLSSPTPPMKAELLLPSDPDSCSSLENALWSLAAGPSFTQILG